MKVAIVAEYYPRPTHPGLGIWAHRQTRAVRDLGVDARVLVLERPLPSMDAVKALVPGRGRPDSPLREWASSVWHPPRDMVLDGVPLRYVRFVSPPRPLSYANWGRWAARPIKRALDELHEKWPFDLVHAHYAVPAGDAVLRWFGRRARLPFVVSVHGGDLFYTAKRSDHGRRVVSRVLGAADAIMANSDLTRRGVEALGAAPERVHIVHPGADPAAEPTASRHPDPTLVTVANLEAHKSQGDVIRALAALSDRHPRLHYVMIGRGPDRSALETLADSLGVGDRVRFTGGLSHSDAMAELARCHLHVMPSRIDGFGVAHVEAMAAGVPTIGSAGTGAEDIAHAGDGALLVRPGDATELVRVLDGLLSEDGRRQRLGEQARRTVAERFSWEAAGKRTAAIYRSLSSAHDG